jgi:hypothetical protein
MVEGCAESCEQIVSRGPINIVSECPSRDYLLHPLHSIVCWNGAGLVHGGYCSGDGLINAFWFDLPIVHPIRHWLDA